MRKTNAFFILTLLLLVLLFCLTGCGEAAKQQNSLVTEAEPVSRVHGAKYEDPNDYTFEQGAVYDRLDSEVFDK